MTIFDLLFAALFLTSAGVLIVAAVAAIHGRRAHALDLVRRVGLVAALYFGVLLVVSAVSPQRYLRVGDEQCSEDWCIAVQQVRRDSAAGAMGYDATFRVSSRARRASQRERFVAVFLRDDAGRLYAPVPLAGAAPFDTLLSPGEAVKVTRRFVVPALTRVVGLVITRAGAGWFPGCCIIGDDGSLLHRRAIVRLD